MGGGCSVQCVLQPLTSGSAGRSPPATIRKTQQMAKGGGGGEVGGGGSGKWKWYWADAASSVSPNPQPLFRRSLTSATVRKTQQVGKCVCVGGERGWGGGRWGWLLQPPVCPPTSSAGFAGLSPPAPAGTRHVTGGEVCGEGGGGGGEKGRVVSSAGQTLALFRRQRCGNETRDGARVGLSQRYDAILRLPT